MSSKQAVLLIHGIGEQKPMQTLRGFVDTVWSRDTKIHHEFAGDDVWSKPDTVSRSYELRRLTTPQNKEKIRTDFFEFYWAHMMQGTQFGHVIAWTRSLLLRRPGTVPKHLRSVYWLIIAVLTVAAAFMAYAFTRQSGEEAALPVWLSVLISVAIVPALGFAIKSIVGDAARYLHVAPPNVQCRHEIRRAGVDILNELHKRGYDRIIVVGHSLGSVIGYDILTHAWPEYHRKAPTTAPSNMSALNELEAMAVSGAGQDEIQAAQRKYFNELKSNGNEWKVTDFITMGSPLAHSEILLAKDAIDLAAKIEEREFPTCLPALETMRRDGKDVKRFSFDLGGNYRASHHAAVFAPTRWTNLYFPCRFIFWGDLVGGTLANILGDGIRDKAVTTTQRGGMLTHTLYWTYGEEEEAPSHIQTLREALNLLDE
jgi:hypothetical protein